MRYDLHTLSDGLRCARWAFDDEPMLAGATQSAPTADEAREWVAETGGVVYVPSGTALLYHVPGVRVVPCASEATRA